MTGASAYGLYATNGGIIETSGTPTVNVTTSGAGAIGVYASGTSTSSPTTPSTITRGRHHHHHERRRRHDHGRRHPGFCGRGGRAGGQRRAGDSERRFDGDAEHGHHHRRWRDRALRASGGTININGPTAISTSGTTSTTATGGLIAYGVKANGLGSQVNLNAATTVTTNGSGAAGLDAYGLYANNGGTIDATGTPSVSVTTYGTGANGVYASGTSNRQHPPRRRRSASPAPRSRPTARRRPASWPTSAGR